MCSLQIWKWCFCLNVDCALDLEENESEVRKSFRNEQVDK